MLLPASFSRHTSSLRSLNRKWHRLVAKRTENNDALSSRMLEVFLRTWDLGFTSFGGPPVHFHILHGRFVQGIGGKEPWVDEQTYQELFAVCQGLPGPASTKMIFCLTLLHAGFIPALLVFFIWSLPGAIGMYALSLGVQKIGDTLPLPVYALLSGLNSSTVGIIALAAVQLAEKAIRDKLTRILVIFSACAGLCYNSLWYFPLLMVVGGLATVIWDGWMSQQVRKTKLAWRRRHTVQPTTETELATMQSVPMEDGGRIPASSQNDDMVGSQSNPVRSRNVGPRGESIPSSSADTPLGQGAEEHPPPSHSIRVRVGILITVGVFASFIGLLVGRSVTHQPPLALDLFTNMYLAGTIIFGGGPVVIPLLRSYVVGPGWVSSRDFLLGLAIIQAFPGPNFNFAVYLGALALQNSKSSTIFGAFLGGLGIFFPGIALAVAVQSFWKTLRKQKWVVDFLKGVNATAVGFVFTAVYRLWEIGYLTPETTNGQSLAKEPWWVVIAVVTYAESAWFKVPSAAAIIIGAVLGLCWYGVVGY
ncbi:chromate transporter-domain-containing protein [Aspergillus transmontanensis]|uniref:Chromate transporter-domain-containing protein n=1 Tax=Aspergillus transmontanensis TaxID=1034304 RepID=A0A5N6W250_9EURO|nr:chromate transporter-domain-containing protein [Aspergillus transmontanensis]